jgi:hypothetical protein
MLAAAAYVVVRGSFRYHRTVRMGHTRRLR